MPFDVSSNLGRYGRQVLPRRQRSVARRVLPRPRKTTPKNAHRTRCTVPSENIASAMPPAPATRWPHAATALRVPPGELFQDLVNHGSATRKCRMCHRTRSTVRRRFSPILGAPITMDRGRTRHHLPVSSATHIGPIRMSVGSGREANSTQRSSSLLEAFTSSIFAKHLWPSTRPRTGLLGFLRRDGNCGQSDRAPAQVEFDARDGLSRSAIPHAASSESPDAHRITRPCRNVRRCPWR